MSNILGIDIGSLTIKAAIYDPLSGKVEELEIVDHELINCFSWNTIASWQYLACQAAGEFNDHKLKGVELIELQADEIRTFAGTKKKPMWIFMFLITRVRVEKFTWISA